MSGTAAASFFTYCIPIWHSVAAASFTASGLLVSAVVVQQYFAVSRPLFPRQLSVVVAIGRSRELSLRPAIYLSIFSVLLRFPAVFELNVVSCFDEILGSASVEVQGTRLRENAFYQKVYLVGSAFVFNSLGKPYHHWRKHVILTWRLRCVWNPATKKLERILYCSNQWQ